jgi:hypothetical protein
MKSDADLSVELRKAGTENTLFTERRALTQSAAERDPLIHIVE